MTQGPSTGRTAPSGGANPLAYAAAANTASERGQATARNVLVIALKGAGLLIILPGLWVTLDQVVSAAALSTGMRDGYWAGWDWMLVQGLLDPAPAYVIGGLLFALAERIAPLLLPKRWWR